MKRRLLVSIAVTAILLVAFSFGCATEAEQPNETGEEATGLAGKTLYLATLTESGDSAPASRTETQTAVGTVDQWRDQQGNYDQMSSDARVAGPLELLIQSDGLVDGSAALWGTLVLKNPDGTWEGDWSGEWSASDAVVPSVFYLRMVAKGSGAYDGLEFYQQGYRDEEISNVFGLGEAGGLFEPGTDFVMTGWIQEAD